ncbi:hypothetical protein AVEN_146345-1 [Araneus ventricosus]|uniref:Uncharacterized protein n=1 Tax=Araneus ventricosus TaxID=182803 RepID=A0A4Y2HAD7_ARAVE|nr:hypothetical protein AVEN_146345-1 [Araneus ventricosus]
MVEDRVHQTPDSNPRQTPQSLHRPLYNKRHLKFTHRGMVLNELRVDDIVPHLRDILFISIGRKIGGYLRVIVAKNLTLLVPTLKEISFCERTSDQFDRNLLGFGKKL